MTVEMIGWSMRPATQYDREFLLDLHRATMRAVIEMAWGWVEEWQKVDLEKRLAECSVSILEWGLVPIGALFLQIQPDSVYVRELQLAHEFQCQGIGTAVMRRTISDAIENKKRVKLQVAVENPGAKRLYERLGFRTVREIPPVVEMEFSTRRLSQNDPSM